MKVEMPKHKCNTEFSFSKINRNSEEAKRHRQTHYKKNRENGLCVVCGKPTGTEGARCAGCNVKVNAKECRRRKRYTEEGRCRDCGKEAQLSNRSMRGRERGNYCRDCAIKVLATTVLGSRKHWRVLVQKLDACGWRCPYTGETLVLGVNLSFDHMDPICRFPEKKYDPNNIEPISWQINLMKRDLTKIEFLELIQRINEYGKLHKPS